MNVNDVVESMVAQIPRAVLVSSLGTATSAARAATDDGPHFYFGAAMGSALAGAVGLAEQVPDRRVVAVLGDGEFLMGAGSLWTLASIHPANLLVVVLADGTYSITGGQPLPTRLQLADLASSLPPLSGQHVADLATLRGAVRAWVAGEGPCVIEAQLDERVWPGPSPFVDPAWVVAHLRAELLGTPS